MIEPTIFSPIESLFGNDTFAAGANNGVVGDHAIGAVTAGAARVTLTPSARDLTASAAPMEFEVEATAVLATLRMA